MPIVIQELITEPEAPRATAPAVPEAAGGADADLREALLEALALRAEREERLRCD